MKKKSAPIGIFDSGVGGLTVAKEIIRFLPNEDIIYFGDTARVPYGTKSRETVVRFSRQNSQFLLKKNVKLIVVACNTSSSLALSFLKKYLHIPVLGVIEPGVMTAVLKTKNKRIGIIGTKATINSKAYERAIKDLDSTIRVVARPCPLFVSLVEEGWLKEKETVSIAKKYLKIFKEKKVDTLILGCTHYPLLKSVIKKIMGRSVYLVDSAKEVAKQAKIILHVNNLLSKKRGASNKIFYVSDEPQMFIRLAKNFLGNELRDIRKVENV